jgi:GNAT superfamily N-acetyltransferase
MLTAQVEPLTDRLDELKPMFPAHWEELALDREHVPLDPQYDEYLRRDALGMVLLVTLRRDGELVGYYVGFIAPGLHYRTCLTLTMDIYWTHPDIRGGSAGLRLFRAVEREAKRRGVQRIIYGSKLHKDSSRLFEAVGARPIETYFSKWIGG